MRAAKVKVVTFMGTLDDEQSLISRDVTGHSAHLPAAD